MISMTNQLPKTGRIGRLIRMLQTETEPDSCGWILEGAERYDTLNAEGKAAWWRSAAGRMESRLGRERAIGIMRWCGAKCCGKGQRSTAERLFREAGTLEAFLKRISRHDVKEGDLTYTPKDENTIIAEHHRRFCRQVAHAKEPFDSPTYCHCSAALGRTVHAELLQSIACGADRCKFRITL
jgi:hypothetical protein